jgi:hypothetical protein
MIRLFSGLGIALALACVAIWLARSAAPPGDARTAASVQEPASSWRAHPELATAPSAPRTVVDVQRRVELVVIDAEGVVVPNSELEVWAHDGRVTTESIKPGVFLVPTGELFLAVVAPGFTPHLSRQIVAGEATEIQLIRPRRLQLLLIDAKGNPVNRAQVRVRAEGQRQVLVDDLFAQQWLTATDAQKAGLCRDLWGRELPSIGVAAVAKARTNELGQVELDLASAEVVIEVRAPRAVRCEALPFADRGKWSVSAPLDVPKHGSSLVLRLEAGVVIRGRIAVDAGGTANGSVVLRHESSGGERIVVRDIERKVALNRDGTFSFMDVRAGSKTVVVTSRRGAEEVVFMCVACEVKSGDDRDLGELVPAPGSVSFGVSLVDAATRSPVDAPGVCFRVVVSTNPEQGPVIAEGLAGVPAGTTIRVLGLPSGRVSVEADLEQGVVLPHKMRILDASRLSREDYVVEGAKWQLEAGVCSFVATDVVVSGLSGRASTQGELVDVASGQHYPLSFPRDDQTSVRISKDLPVGEREYRYALLSDTGDAGAWASGVQNVTGGRAMQIELQPAAAARLIVKDMGGEPVPCRLTINGGNCNWVVHTDRAGVALVKGLIPDADYEVRLEGRDLSRMQFPGGDVALMAVRGGTAGSVVDLGLVTVRETKH